MNYQIRKWKKNDLPFLKEMLVNAVYWDEENHTIFSDKSNKAAGSRARKAAGEFKKIVTDYRKASVAESK